MALYEVYATKDDLAEFLGISVEDLPTDSERKLSRASEMVKRSTMGNLDFLNIDHLEAAKLATCAQVEHWLEVGEFNIPSGLKNFSLGDLNMSFGDSDASQLNNSVLCSRARDYLNDQGLLYRGVKIGKREVQNP